ncbi:hypothetical protein RhiJN_21384 [Ceratobasidium sp. AG-Ba]|nr:hypothetical protein RhiJN_21384 [Ceratobasidium sp. AG-Ba]
MSGLSTGLKLKRLWTGVQQTRPFCSIGGPALAVGALAAGCSRLDCLEILRLRARPSHDGRHHQVEDTANSYFALGMHDPAPSRAAKRYFDKASSCSVPTCRWYNPSPDYKKYIEAFNTARSKHSTFESENVISDSELIHAQPEAQPSTSSPRSSSTAGSSEQHCPLQEGVDVKMKIDPTDLSIVPENNCQQMVKGYPSDPNICGRLQAVGKEESSDTGAPRDVAPAPLHYSSSNRGYEAGTLRLPQSFY